VIRPGSARAIPRRLGSALMMLLCAAAAGCTSREEARLRDTTLPTYDPSTGRLKELTFDANKNGRIDTWTEMDGARPLRARIDRDEDGTPDRWEYYGENGQITKVAFSRADNGKPDAWAYPGPSGAIERIEISSIGDENKIDRWERYAPGSGQGSSELGPLTAVDEDSNGDGKPDKWETYEAGSLKTVAFDENYDGRPDRRLTYDSGLVSIETEPDGSGGYLKLVRVK
jgi:hypothetical protein